MAYLSALWNGDVQTVAFTRGDAHMATVWVGYDSELPINYHLLVEMYPTEQGTEFAFAIVQENRITLEAEALFDSAVTNSIIPRSFRPKIRDILLDLTGRVVRAANRSAFFMVTFCDNLPVQALTKYQMLCEVFDSCGYDSIRTEPLPGKHFWQMTRR